MAGNRPTLFIADLHLTAQRPAANERFFGFLEDSAQEADALYILGDLFETWVGDDDLAEPLHAQVADALARLTRAGVTCGIQHGNRDFLLGEAFQQATGTRLLPEASRLDLHGVPTLLLHGDSLCTDDTAYQQLRTQLRNPAWQAGLLARPLAERRMIARQLRDLSEQDKGGKSMAIMDVNEGAVAALFRTTGVDRIIHGHTHRPARHQTLVDGRPRERWVLPDWYDQGGYLVCDQDGCRLEPLEA